MQIASSINFVAHPFSGWWKNIAELTVITSDLMDGNARQWTGSERSRAKAKMDDLLIVAHRGGFLHSDVLRAAMERGRMNEISLALLQAAVAVSATVVARDAVDLYIEMM